MGTTEEIVRPCHRKLTKQRDNIEGRGYLFFFKLSYRDNFRYWYYNYYSLTPPFS